jgi:hypothetical protein
MVGSDNPAGARSPVADLLTSGRSRDVVGNKADAASNLPSASLIARQKWLTALFTGTGYDKFRQVAELAEWVPDGSSTVFAISLINISTGAPVPLADITAGNIDVVRVRAGAETTIHSAQVLTKKDGLLYFIIDTNTANWQADDVIKVIQETKSQVDIGGDTFDVFFAPQNCLISDMGDIQSDVTAIKAVTDTLAPGYGGSSGTLSFDETSAAEQAVTTVAISSTTEIRAIWLDMTNITEATIDVILEHEVDGSTLRKFQKDTWNSGDNPGILIEGFTVDDDFKLILQGPGGGVGSVNVPWKIL